MVWKKIKEIIKGKKNDEPEKTIPSPSENDLESSNQPTIPESVLIEANNTPWGVPVYDVRPTTQTMLSSSPDPAMATNAVSYNQEDGFAFFDQKPWIARSIQANLSFPIDGALYDGPLFIPNTMEHKWAIYFIKNKMIFIRSWLRQVRVVAEVKQLQDHISITSITGAFLSDTEPQEFTIRILDYLLRSHAMNLVFPAPIPTELDQDIGIWCMRSFGNLAMFATSHPIESTLEQPLRSHSLLHIAVARGDSAAVLEHLNAGVPIDLIASDGLTPLHWSLVQQDNKMLSLLIEKGSPVDARSDTGATPLMNAVQSHNQNQIDFLIEHGADVNAQDNRGFTALHRAAEMGKADLVYKLLENGASANISAQGFTPKSLAENRNEADALKIFTQFENNT